MDWWTWVYITICKSIPIYVARPDFLSDFVKWDCNPFPDSGIPSIFHFNSELRSPSNSSSPSSPLVTLWQYPPPDPQGAAKKEREKDPSDSRH